MREWANFTRNELDKLKVVIAELRQKLDEVGNYDGESIVDLLRPWSRKFSENWAKSLDRNQSNDDFETTFNLFLSAF